MRLDLLVTHYQEPWKTVKPLFDSIAMQRGVDFKNVRVLMVNDGKDGALDASEWAGYPFEVVYLVKEHEGVSAARNYALDKSDADYVMFCDCDDCFMSSFGLHLVFSAMQEGFDTCSSCFIEEQPNGTGGCRILRHDNDVTFIHGKVHNRQFLVDNELRFNEKLTLHEDGYFNCLVRTVAENAREISTPFYLWAWNDESVVRKEPEFFKLKTYGHLIKSRIALCEQLEKRGFIDQFYDAVCRTVVDVYYDMQKPECLMPENKDFVKSAEKAFKKFYMKYREYYLECNVNRIAEAMQLSRANAFARGMRIEQQTISEFLNHITKDV